MGGAYYQLGEISRAVEFYEQAFGIYREVSDHTKEITALGNIVSIYIAQGDSQKSKSLLIKYWQFPGKARILT
jgi:tetratricopeptide (TPR) repeat protein